MSRIQDARRWSRSVGWRPVCRLGMGLAASRAAGRGHRMHVRPSFDDMLSSAGGRFLFDAQQMVEALGWTADEIRPLVGEFREVTGRLSERYRDLSGSLPFPVPFRVEEKAGLF